MGRRRHTLDPEEEILWESVTRTVRAYGKTPKIDLPLADDPGDFFPWEPETALPSAMSFVPPEMPAHWETRVDPDLSRRLRRGQVAIQGRLDLHGMTQNQAHRALSQFLRHSIAQGRRCVLVITGKGRSRRENPAESVGVLKTQVPLWLQEPAFAALILSISIARPADGGQGAYYILLRRDRSRGES